MPTNFVDDTLLGVIFEATWLIRIWESGPWLGNYYSNTILHGLIFCILSFYFRNL